MYLQRDMPPVPVGDWTDVFARWADPRRPDALVGEIDPRTLHRARAGYYGHMTHIDHQVNRFLETLDEWGLGENTYVCFTSDHGEMMGDHHLFRKGYPYEGSARIPMLLAGPKGGDAIPPGVHDEPVELRDVMPALLECAGLESPTGVEGMSMLLLAQGSETAWRADLHGEHTLLGQSLHWVTDGHDKYIWFSGDGREQLFDLDDDPHECHDLAVDPDHQAELERWRQRLIAYVAGCEEGYTDGQRLIAGRPVQACLGFLRRQAGLQ
jgi:arylsulfatase A-like enzyme